MYRTLVVTMYRTPPNIKINICKQKTFSIVLFFEWIIDKNSPLGLNMATEDAVWWGGGGGGACDQIQLLSKDTFVSISI